MNIFKKKELPKVKKALLVGINTYPTSMNANLQGCVNDVCNMRSLLINKYGFDPDNIRVLLDSRATRLNILQRLEWLINPKEVGKLVFHYSGHGSYIRDRDGDELVDGVDEILIPYDHNWDFPLSDDNLYNVIKKKPKESFLTFIADCCHSGTMIRSFNNGLITSNQKNRFIPPPIDINMRIVDRNINKNRLGFLDIYNYSFISGCKDNQTSADANINGTWNGALTYAITTILMKQPSISYARLHNEIISLLHQKGFDQNPQLLTDIKNMLVF